MALPEQREAAEAVEARQLEVEQDEVGPRPRDQRLDLQAGAGGPDHEEPVGMLEDLADRAQHQWVVLDDHNAGVHGRQSRGTRGLCCARFDGSVVRFRFTLST